MKYNELERKLREIGCYPIEKSLDGHPTWFSPKTGKEFKFSHHGKAEVAKGTLNAILKVAGAK